MYVRFVCCYIEVRTRQGEFVFWRFLALSQVGRWKLHTAVGVAVVSIL